MSVRKRCKFLHFPLGKEQIIGKEESFGFFQQILAWLSI